MDIKNLLSEVISFEFCYYGMGALDQPVLTLVAMLVKMTNLSHMGRRSNPKWPIKKMVMKAKPNIKVPNHEAISVSIEVVNAIGDELTTIAMRLQMPLTMMNHHMLSMELPTPFVMNQQLLPMKLPMPLVKVHKLLTLKLHMLVLVKVYHVLPLKLPIP